MLSDFAYDEFLNIFKEIKKNVFKKIEVFKDIEFYDFIVHVLKELNSLEFLQIFERYFDKAAFKQTNNKTLKISDIKNLIEKFKLNYKIISINDVEYVLEKMLFLSNEDLNNPFIWRDVFNLFKQKCKSKEAFLVFSICLCVSTSHKRELSDILSWICIDNSQYEYGKFFLNHFIYYNSSNNSDNKGDSIQLEPVIDMIDFLVKEKKKFDDSLRLKTIKGFLSGKVELKSPDGVSESVINLKKIINYCTKKNDNKVVVFLGNSGTGKTFLAKYFHSLDRPESQFCCVPVNKFSNLKELSCFLFGERNHLKNTGFQHGLLNILNGGTLFLKNLETLDIAGLELIRTIILKRRFRPVDSLDNKYQKINCRIILAFTLDSECNLLKKIGIKDFFKDVENIYLPVKNLSQRKDDIIWLSDSFLKQQSEMLVRDSRVLSKKILQRMKEYKWPGNIRELKQVVLTASLLSSEKLITQAFLPERILKNFR